MNDFTKEELHLINHVITMETIRGACDFTDEIIDKIQDMIDNYCEHDCKATIWQCQVTACSKCNFPSTMVMANK